MFIDEILQNRRALRVYPRPGLIRFDQTATQSVASVAADNLNETQQKTLVLHLAKQFGKETTIHGLNHVFAGSESKTKRFVWTLSFLMALVCLVYVCLYLAHRYNQRTFKTTVETTSYPIYKISFPEITICNRNRLNWARLEVAKSHFLLPQHRHNEYEQLFTEVVALYDTLTISQMERFDQFARRPLAALNYINFTSVVGLLAWHCDELLTDCTWRQQQKNCCDIFIPRYSQQGLCWAFNSVESAQGALKQFLDSKWPWRANTQGAGNGLTVRVLMNEQKHSPFSRNEIKGLTFMAVQPNVWNSYRTEVGSNVKANIRFTASLSFYDEQTRSLHSRVRKCVFPDERNSDHFRSLQGHIYMRENCQSECQQEHLMRYCNCTMDLFYPPGPYPACKLVDLPCVAKYSRRLVNFELNGEEQFVAQKRRGIVCQCYRNCRSLRYLTEVRTQPLPPEERLANDSLVDMDFYFLFNTITVYKTSLIYTWVDLMVSFGGITALFLGCSLISIVELVYFFFVDVPQQVRVKRHKSKKRTKRTELVESAYESVDTASKRKTGMILKY